MLGGQELVEDGIIDCFGYVRCGNLVFFPLRRGMQNGV
jgi:hypothetical protein